MKSSYCEALAVSTSLTAVVGNKLPEHIWRCGRFALQGQGVHHATSGRATVREVKVYTTAAAEPDPSRPLTPLYTHVLPCLLLYLGLIRALLALTSHAIASMPVLELTQLRLKAVVADDPALLNSLSVARGKLKTNSQFYNGIEDPTLVFILGIWPSLDAHHQFLSSPARDDVLGPQEDLLDFQWSLHMELDAMTSLPLDAPVLAITRLFIKGECVTAYEQAAAKNTRIVADISQHKALNGWRYDAEPGKHEAIIFTGWDSVQAHHAFFAKAADTDFSNVSALCEASNVSHCRNMEKTHS